MPVNEDWSELTDADVEALRPLMLDGRGLSSEATAELRSTYTAAMQHAIQSATEALGREPTEDEVRMLTIATVRHLNEQTVPLLRQRAVGLH